MALSKLFVSLSTQGTAQVKRDLSDVEKRMKSLNSGSKGKALGGQTQSGFGGIGGLGGVAGVLTKLTAVGAAIGVATGGLKKMNEMLEQQDDLFKQRAQDARQVSDLAAAFGLSTEEASEFAVMADRSKVAVEDLASAMNDINERARSGSAGYRGDFANLGLNMDDLAKMSPAQAFKAFAEAYRNTTDEGVRAAAASELLGDNYRRLLPILNATASEWERITSNMDQNKFGMDDDELRRIKSYNVELDRMQEKWDRATERLSDHESTFTKYARAFRNWRTDVYEAFSLYWENWSKMSEGPPANLTPTFTPSETTPGQQAMRDAYRRNDDASYRNYMQGTYGGGAGRAFGEFGIPFAPDVNANAAMFEWDRDNAMGYLGGISDEEGYDSLSDALSDAIVESLGQSEILPESSMWSSMLDDLREGNAILRSIDGALQIIQRKDGDSTEVYR